MNRKGMTLIEILVAVTIFCMAATVAYKVLFSGIKFSNRVQRALEAEGHALLFFSEVEKDLKNAVSYTAVPFHGENFKLSFASIQDNVEAVRYDFRNGSVFKTSNTPEYPVIKDLRDFFIEYAYQNEKGELVFLPFWNAQTLPKAVRFSLSFAGDKTAPISSIVILPQGNMGKIG